jgi:Fis family transcriptional regulator
MTSAKPKTPTKKNRGRSAGPPPLRESAAEAIGHFLSTLDGEACSDLYDMVLHQVEEPLLRAVMEYSQQNQSHASAMLGLNRGTLRKKLRQHGLLTEPEPQKTKRHARPAEHPRHQRPSTRRT